MLTGDPVMVTCRSPAASVWFPILMWAPDICRISLILLPCRPMMQPMSWRGRREQLKGPCRAGSNQGLNLATLYAWEDW